MPRIIGSSHDDRNRHRRRGDADSRRVRVWDLPIRLFHWLTVALVVAAYATWRANRMDWHARIGEILLALLLFRLLWGLFGSDTARFSRFLTMPRAALRHLALLLRREPDRQPGHNPAGGWMVVLLLLLLLGETLTGIYVANDVADVGPMTAMIPAPVADAIDRLHAVLWNVLLAAIGLHLVAILTYAVAKRQNLLLPMITGVKTLPRGVPQPRFAGLPRAACLLAAGAAGAALIVLLS